MNLSDHLSMLAAAHPAQPAVHLARRTIGFAELDGAVWAVADGLYRSGVRRGMVVAHRFHDELVYLVTMLATARLGATVFSLPGYGPGSAVERLPASSKAAFCVTDRAPLPLGDVASISVTRAALTAAVQSDLRVLRDPDPGPWLLVASSGSTGQSRYYAVTHQACLSRIELWNQAIALRAGDRVLAMSEIGFTGTKQRYLEGLLSGAAVVLYDRARADPVAVCRAYGVTVMSATAAHVEWLLRRYGAPGSFALAGLRVLRLGASTISDDLRRRVTAALCTKLWISYSTNESGVIALADPEAALAVPGGVGKVIAGIDLQIVDEADRVLPCGQAGQIRLQSPGTVNGYVEDEQATARHFRQRWYYPGDLGQLTADGHLVHLGRADHLMIMNGINIYPGEIEQCLSAHPAVRDAAAVPLKHPIHQDIPVCAVALHAGAAISAPALLAYGRDRLGAHGPRQVVVVDAIPRNELGKLRREDLYAQLYAALGLDRAG